MLPDKYERWAVRSQTERLDSSMSEIGFNR